MLIHYSKEPFFVSGGAGGSGRSLEFNWDGTRLGIRQEGEEEYDYVDLIGPQGNDGADGFPTEEEWSDLLARVEALEE